MRRYIDDIRKSQKGKPNPIKSAPSSTYRVCFFKVLTAKLLSSCMICMLGAPELRDNDDYRIYKIFKEREMKSYLVETFKNGISS